MNKILLLALFFSPSLLLAMVPAQLAPPASQAPKSMVADWTDKVGKAGIWCCTQKECGTYIDVPIRPISFCTACAGTLVMAWYCEHHNPAAPPPICSDSYVYPKAAAAWGLGTAAIALCMAGIGKYRQYKKKTT